jgi:hypothetical protein
MRQIDFGFAAAHQRDFRSQPGKSEREPLADSSSGACNQNVFLLEFPVNFNVRRYHAGSDLRVEQRKKFFHGTVLVRAILSDSEFRPRGLRQLRNSLSGGG